MSLVIKIPTAELQQDSRLMLDYLSSPEGLPARLLGRFPRGEGDWNDRVAAAVVAHKHPGWTALLDELLAFNQAAGVSDEVGARLEEARTGECSFVLTGQQPGALGGSLLGLYKAATAVALARRLEQSSGKPCVPLYWVGADDVDFAEIRSYLQINPDLSPLASALSDDAHAPAMPVGDISVESERLLWDSVRPFTASAPGELEVAAMVSSALDGARDHGQVVARMVVSALGGAIAVVDGRSAAVRNAARDLFSRYVQDEDSVRAHITATGEELEAHGYHAQLWAGPDSGVFVMRDGRRTKVPWSQRETLRSVVDDAVEQCSPGVILRNLVQDFVFEPVAVVLGAAEVAYRAQMHDVYDRFEVKRPVSFPRMHATYLPPEVSRLLADDDSPPVSDLIREPAAFVRALYQSCARGEVGEAADALRSDYHAAVGTFHGAADAHLPAATQRKLRKRLDDVGRRLEQALDGVRSFGREAALARWPFVEHLEDMVRRSGRPQERSLSLLSPLLLSGASAGDVVAAAADTYVDDAMDGRVSHIVYSS